MTSKPAITILRRAARILWWMLLCILTRRISVNVTRTRMSETVKSEPKSVQGTVEQVNKAGIKVAGTWYDYGRAFQGDRLDKEAVGQSVRLSLVEARNGKPYIRSVESASDEEEDALDLEDDGAESKPEGASPGLSAEASAKADEDAASDKALKYAGDLAEKAGLSDDDVERILQIRFKKSLADLTAREASRTIVFFGGYSPKSGQ